MNNNAQILNIQAGSLVVLSGLPGSGKSSLKARIQGMTPDQVAQAWVSSDELRERMLGSMQDIDSDGRSYKRLYESANDTVFAVMTAMARARLTEGLTTFIDAVNPTDSDRAGWIALADACGAPSLVVILDVSVEDCKERNRTRVKRVPESVIDNLAHPPAPVASANQKGSKTPPTAPTGFMRTSSFNHVLASPDCQLTVSLPRLEHDRYDVVGDTHGLLPEFLQLLQRAGWQYANGHLSHPQQRKLLLLGDLVDRGEHSVELVRLVKQAVEDGVALALLGNHESKLLRFLDVAQKTGFPEPWSSYANADTGMQMLKLPAAERESLVTFLRRLPSCFVYEAENLAFVHGDIHRFSPFETLADAMVYGESGPRRGVDSDALYAQRYAQGLNKHVMFRGHIPQTSEQECIFSLERHPFQKGELVLMRLDDFIRARREGASNAQAFAQSLLTQACDFDYDAHSARKFAVIRGMESLVGKKMVTRQTDDTNILRVYKYSKQTFWNNSWGESDWLLKARGLVLDVAGNIVSHPFDKCFNYGENGTGRDLPDDLPVIEVEKLNGFLGIVSRHPLKPSELLVHTQGGFGGPFVEYIKHYVCQPAVRGQITRFLLQNDVTLMFEVLHPDDPHIIAYPDEMMGVHLIGVRGKRLEDQPWTEEAVDEAARQMQLRRPRWWRTTFGAVKTKLETDRTEGAMVRRDDATQETLLKIKTPYYLTTKFLGRLSASKVAHMYGNPENFKRTVDEEFYPIVDLLVTKVDKDTFLAMSDEERVPLVRELIHELL